MKRGQALIACSLLFMLAGCGTSHPASDNNGSTPSDTDAISTESVSRIDMTAKVNPKTATIDLPGDGFDYLSWAEQGKLSDAYAVARFVCAKKIGIPFQTSVGRGDAPEYAMFKGIGPWTEEMANRFAFTGPSTLADQVYNGIISKPKDFKRKKLPTLSDEQLNIIDEKCSDLPEFKVFDQGRLDKIRPPAANELLFMKLMKNKLPKSKVYQAAISDLKRCYQEVGITIKKSEDGPIIGFEIIGANYHKVNEQQIALALKDVQCKTKVDFVNRVAQEAAKIQAPIIEKNIKEFTAWRKEVDETLKKAEEYIAAHQDVILKD